MVDAEAGVAPGTTLGFEFGAAAGVLLVAASGLIVARRAWLRRGGLALADKVLGEGRVQALRFERGRGGVVGAAGLRGLGATFGSSRAALLRAAVADSAAAEAAVAAGEATVAMVAAAVGDEGDAANRAFDREVAGLAVSSALAAYRAQKAAALTGMAESLASTHASLDVVLGRGGGSCGSNGGGGGGGGGGGLGASAGALRSASALAGLSGSLAGGLGLVQSSGGVADGSPAGKLVLGRGAGFSFRRTRGWAASAEDFAAQAAASRRKGRLDASASAGSGGDGGTARLGETGSLTFEVDPLGTRYSVRLSPLPSRPGAVAAAAALPGPIEEAEDDAAEERPASAPAPDGRPPPDARPASSRHLDLQSVPAALLATLPGVLADVPLVHGGWFAERVKRPTATPLAPPAPAAGPGPPKWVGSFEPVGHGVAVATTAAAAAVAAADDAAASRAAQQPLSVGPAGDDEDGEFAGSAAARAEATVPGMVTEEEPGDGWRGSRGEAFVSTAVVLGGRLGASRSQRLVSWDGGAGGAGGAVLAGSRLASRLQLLGDEP